MDSAPCSGPVVAEDNIINRRGGESLYQTCANLKKRLAEVPGFEPYLAQIDSSNDNDPEADDTDNDPVASVWRCLRSGYPLMTIYNASNPKEPITIDESKVPESKRPKMAAFKFLQACLSDLACPQQDCFLLADLYSESTTGFVKVIKMVNKVLDMLEAQGHLYKPSDTHANDHVKETGQVKLTRRQHILKEMIETERDYVLHMENLQALRKELEQCGAISGDTIHQIFLNLHNLLDFAQKFLIGMEQHYARSEEKQNWGELFLSHKEGFQDYEPFIANQTTCDALCTKEWNKIVAAPKSADLQQMVAQLSTLNGFFVKPFQRLTKYPLMLKELQKTTEQENLKTDIQSAIDMVQDVLDQANHAIDKEQLDAAVVDLSTRIEDWKALKPETFGDLVRHGSFHCTREGGKDNDREFTLFLFENVLICLKEIPPNKSKTKLMGGKEKTNSNQRAKTKFQIKGRVHMANITVLRILDGPVGSHRVLLAWSSADPDMARSFAIKFPTEDSMRTWVKDIERLRAAREQLLAPPPPPPPASTTASPSTEPETLQIRNGSQYLHPTYNNNSTYHAYSEDEDGGYADVALWQSISGTGSGSRSRSATQGSSNGSLRHRFPMTDIPPLHTQFPLSLSPGERPIMSYFSPADTASTRSSQSTNFFVNSKLGTPTTTVGEEPVNRHTAPAMPRSNSKDGTNYHANGTAKAQRPSLPAYASHSQYPPGAQARFRSASSPDIHNNNNGGGGIPGDSRRVINGTHAHTMQTVDNVPVPPIPPHVAGVRAPITPPSASPPNSMSGRPSHVSTPSHHSANHVISAGGQQPPSLPLPQTPTSNLAHSSYNTTSLSDQELTPSEAAMPAQLKAKVNFNDNYVTLVIPLNIMFRSLTDRVDAKLKRFTDQSIGENTVRLRYRDEDGDFITIDSDEAVQLAFMDWRDQHQEKLASGLVGEIHLFCQPI